MCLHLSAGSKKLSHGSPTVAASAARAMTREHSSLASVAAYYELKDDLTSGRGHLSYFPQRAQNCREGEILGHSKPREEGRGINVNFGRSTFRVRSRLEHNVISLGF
jgi:hypothetical protein